MAEQGAHSRLAAPGGGWALQRMVDLAHVEMPTWKASQWGGNPQQVTAWSIRQCNTPVGMFADCDFVNLQVVRTRARYPIRWEGRVSCFRPDPAASGRRRRPRAEDSTGLRVRPDGELSWWSTPEEAMEAMEALLYDDPRANAMWIAPLRLRRHELPP